MRARLRVTALGIAVGFALGCSGIWQQAMSDTIRQQATELRALLAPVAPSPEKDQISVLIDGIEAGATSGRIGVVEIAAFRVEIEDAVYDGAIDANEVAAVKSVYDDMMSE